MPYRAQTALEAGNLALSEISEPPIGSFSDNSARARRVVQWYGIIRDELQRDHDWGFNTFWTVPPMSPVPALGKLKNRFIMPENCLAVRRVEPYRPSTANYGTGISITDPNIIAELEALTNAPLGDHEWDIEAGSVAAEPPAGAMIVVTNMTQPVVQYGGRVDIVRLWSPDFVTMFAKKLGAAIAPPIAKDIGAAERLNADAKELMDDATRRDSREESPRHISRNTSWVASRMLGRGWRQGGPW
jgi:hypothetical protein